MFFNCICINKVVIFCIILYEKDHSKCFIYCEKPPVTSLEGIKFLENLTLEDIKRIFFNFQLRFSKINEILKQYLNSEKLGKIIQINIISSMGFAFKEKYISLNKEIELHVCILFPDLRKYIFP